MEDINNLNSVNYKNAAIFINRKKNEMPFAVLIQDFSNGKLYSQNEKWFFSIAEAKNFINQNNSLYYYN